MKEKQWKDLPAEPTRNMGSHQNPQDLSVTTIRLVRFNETRDKNGRFKWLFFPEQCRHCIEPPCQYMLNIYHHDAVSKDDETGAVVYSDTARLARHIHLEPSQICPYNVPRQNKETGKWSKCDMCIDRVRDGLKPACVQSCPTGTLNFGDREAMLDLAQQRLKEVQKNKPQAFLADPETVRVIYLCESEPEHYHSHLVADAGRKSAILAQTRPEKLSRRQFLAGKIQFKAPRT